ncbi:SJCHGC09143 protein, related [Eimeria tenella]|uniref:SJCHGC09143 protein, related n=1 Tax=Eimeria tenella TaxID=5802 RepID=U6KR36_EIMTE|nr:SJCHGC09143 protein, related [Eimeria tenella]CDJ37878.1 SJCHGC09143 protein, related [Eimeria tenella]|eukprot:XP_013228716.1 SJCHGC09143 protein, related [Eimeria tenella]
MGNCGNSSCLSSMFKHLSFPYCTMRGPQKSHVLRSPQKLVQYTSKGLRCGIVTALLTVSSSFMVSEATQEQRHHHEEEAMGIIDTSAVAIAIGLACVAIAGAFYFFKDRFYSSTSSTPQPRAGESRGRNVDRSALEELMSGGSGASAARSSTRAASTDLQAAQKKKEEREQRREQRRQQGEAAALAAAAAAAAAAAEAASESDQEGAAHMSNKQAKQEAYRKRQAERDRLRAEREAEEERLAEEKRKKEQEEYEEWKKTFEVEAEGELHVTPEEEAKRLEQFLSFIRMRKAVELDEIAAEFGLKTKDCVKRIESLQEAGRLCGVLDDRGRFLCVTKEELHKLAEALKSQGRFSKETDLVSICNRIIRLTPSDEDKAKIEEEQRTSMRLIELAAAEE